MKSILLVSIALLFVCVDCANVYPRMYNKQYEEMANEKAIAPTETDQSPALYPVETVNKWYDGLKDVVMQLLHQLTEYKVFKNFIKCATKFFETSKELVVDVASKMPEMKAISIQNIIIRLLSQVLDAPSFRAMF